MIPSRIALLSLLDARDVSIHRLSKRIRVYQRESLSGAHCMPRSIALNRPSRLGQGRFEPSAGEEARQGAPLRHAVLLQSTGRYGRRWTRYPSSPVSAIRPAKDIAQRGRVPISLRCNDSEPNQITDGIAMTKTTAERQAAYRARQVNGGKDGNGQRRVSMWLSTGAALTLARLASRYGVTQRELIERMVVAEARSNVPVTA